MQTAKHCRFTPCVSVCLARGALGATSVQAWGGDGDFCASDVCGRTHGRDSTTQSPAPLPSLTTDRRALDDARIGWGHSDRYQDRRSDGQHRRAADAVEGGLHRSPAPAPAGDLWQAAACSARACRLSWAHESTILFPPLEMVNTAGPLSVLPEAVVTPPRTVSWPPVGNVCADPSFTSIALLEAT